MSQTVNDNPVMGCYNCPFRAPLSQFGDGTSPGFYCNHPNFSHEDRPMVLRTENIGMETNVTPQFCPLKQQPYEVVYRYRLVK